MEKMITFPVHDKIEYCSIRMNNNDLTSNMGQRADILVEEGVLWKVINSFDNDLNYIIDFLNCEGTINTTKEIFERFAKKNFIILASEKLKNAFIKNKNFKCYFETYGNAVDKCYSIAFDNEGQFYDFFKKLTSQMDGSDFMFFQRLLLTRFFYYDIKNNPQYSFVEGNLKYLESSNVYVNKYINVKSLFLNYNYMILVVKGLKELVKTKFKSDLSDSILLGVSNNGIILANLLSYELQIPVQSLNRLGPVYCLDKQTDRNNQFNNNKYILISDVVCMGGEYKMANGIVDILGSKLIGGICVVKIRDVYRNQREGNLYALLDDINGLEVDGERIGYRIYVDDNKKGGNSNGLLFKHKDHANG